MTARWSLSRAGILNVWQYDEQVFDFRGGRLLLRGTNGAGKSKTLEMLLPFVLDGDRGRIDASGRRSGSLLWLMTDGIDTAGRTGYVWVEFSRRGADGAAEHLTCAVGIRASRTARSVTTWHFTTPQRIGDGLALEDELGPLGKDRCESAVVAHGSFFESATSYKAHVGRLLFGLDSARYDELLRLLYWLRSPQVGELVEPSRLTEVLSLALPEVDETALREAGESFDQLADFGEKLQSRERAVGALRTALATYTRYARGVVAGRAGALLDVERDVRRADAEVARLAREVAQDEQAHGLARSQEDEAVLAYEAADQRLRTLESSPEAKARGALAEARRRRDDLAGVAGRVRATQEKAAARAETAGGRAGAESNRLAADVRVLAAGAQELGRAAAEASLDGMPPWTTGLDETIGSGLPVPERVAAVERHVTALDAFTSRIGRAEAAVAQVRRALAAAVRQETVAAAAQERAAYAAGDAEGADARARDLGTAAASEELAFRTSLAAWATDARATGATLDAGALVLDAGVLDGLAAHARSLAGPTIATLHRQESGAAAALAALSARRAELTRDRERVAAARDAAPEPPVLARSPRDDTAGAPLWRLVDLAPGIDDGVRAGVEAALQSAGLLDAWVRVDGSVLDRERYDVLLSAGTRVAGRALADVLVADVPDDAPVTAAVVTDLLRGVALAESDAQSAGGAAVLGLDGSWRLGPLHGRAHKDVAQYLGAAARAAERARQLAALDTALDDVGRQLSRTQAERAAAVSRREQVEAWLGELPTASRLRELWARLDAATAEAERLGVRASGLATEAARARDAAVAARRALTELAAALALPADEPALDVRARRLREIEALRREHRRATLVLPTQLRRTEAAADDAATATGDAEDAARQAREAGAAAESAAASYDAMREAVEATVLELEQAIADAGEEKAAARDAAAAARRCYESAGEALGAARVRWEAASVRRRTLGPALVAAAGDLAALPRTPGLLDTALRRAADAPGAAPTQRGDLLAGLSGAAGATADSVLPRPVVAAARALRAACPEPYADGNAVIAAHNELLASAAADSEPRLLEVAGAYGLLARIEAAERPLTEVVERVAAGVEADRSLLTGKQRGFFERHLLGDLGESLRQRRRESEELVQEMNRLLTSVRTSQGIGVRLRWELTDDVGTDVRDTVALLGRPVGALLPDERDRLRDLLSRLIEQARAEEPDLGYTDHLRRALDYRSWSTFRVFVTRPGQDGEVRLTKRTPLSQGEQKVVCYLPLFAAAAAHFSSLAGAAPHAPRFILLDDAFPKIDAATHPKLFGLLVSLDLDWVVTSERLWGTHAEVPSLAIYEALRSPHERGIAQYAYRWDGRSLQAVGG